MSKTALVTGSAGFVGRHVARRLAIDDYDVDTCDPHGSDGTDALDLFRDETKRYDLVVHAAAVAPNRKGIDAVGSGHMSYNLQLDAAMLSWAHRVRPGHVVYLSSAAAYPWDMQDTNERKRPLEEDDISLLYTKAPSDGYGWTKLTGERGARDLRMAGVPVTVLRPFSGYGEDQSEEFPFGAIVERARRGENPLVVWGSGNQVRDWIHIDDVVGAMMTMVRTGRSHTVNVCTGVGTTMSRLAYMASQITGYKPKIETDTGQPGGVRYRVGDPAHLNKWYWPRVSVAQGIARRLEAC